MLFSQVSACPLPFSIKSCSRTVCRPSSLSSPSPCSTASARGRSPLKLPSSGTPKPLNHQTSIILRLSQFNSKDSLESPPCSSRQPHPSTTSSPWWSGLLPYLYHGLPWLTCTPLTVSPALPQSTKGGFPGFLSLVPFFSLFSDICSPDFKVYFCKWSPNLYLQRLNMFQSKLTILHLKSDSYSLLLCFCSWHSLNFPGLKPQHYLGFPPCPSALHPID